MPDHTTANAEQWQEVGRLITEGADVAEVCAQAAAGQIGRPFTITRADAVQAAQEHRAEVLAEAVAPTPALASNLVALMQAEVDRMAARSKTAALSDHDLRRSKWIADTLGKLQRVPNRNRMRLEQPTDPPTDLAGTDAEPDTRQGLAGLMA